jgi:hypothetical protein
MDDLNKKFFEPIKLITFERWLTKSFVPLTIIDGGDRVLISSLITVGSVCSVVISLSAFTPRHAYLFKVTNKSLFFFDVEGGSSDERLRFFGFFGWFSKTSLEILLIMIGGNIIFLFFFLVYLLMKWYWMVYLLIFHYVW